MNENLLIGLMCFGVTLVYMIIYKVCMVIFKPEEFMYRVTPLLFPALMIPLGAGFLGIGLLEMIF